MESELKPCPLCGQDCEEAKAVHEQFGEVDIVRCTICGYRVYPDNMHGQWWTAKQSHHLKPCHKTAPQTRIDDLECMLNRVLVLEPGADWTKCPALNWDPTADEAPYCKLTEEVCAGIALASLGPLPEFCPFKEAPDA